ncbi:MAG: hypothetical protein CME06_04305 [Gemmatimonadetes bacterium]|nr:hypothetical protein [Gemmatimonadota bacterium]
MKTLLDNLACPICKAAIRVDGNEAHGGDHLECSSCGHKYPANDEIVDFRVIDDNWQEEGWSVQEFESMYEGREDWNSIYDWDRQRGIPADAST